MTTEVMTVPADWSVAQTLDYIKTVALQKETVYVAYLLDHEERLVGVVSLRQLIVADRSATVLHAGSRRAPVTVTPSTDREEVARVIAKYNLLAVPGRRRGRARTRHRHRGRRDRRDRPRADGGRAEVRRYGGPRRAVHGHRSRAHDSEARAAGSARCFSPRCSRRRRCSDFRARSSAPRCSRCSFRSS